GQLKGSEGLKFNPSDPFNSFNSDPSNSLIPGKIIE
ncbi:MAG: hypothetical protein ACI945_001583, partial [Pseudohongiellaceae bacterium]